MADVAMKIKVNGLQRWYFQVESDRRFSYQVALSTMTLTGSTLRISLISKS